MTEVTLKVMPAPETVQTVLLRGLDDVRAGQAMSAALGSAFDVSGAAHVPVSALRMATDLGGLDAGGQAATVLRLEGFAASVAHRSRALAQALADFGAGEIVDAGTSLKLWSALRDVTPFAAAGPVGAWPLWRIVCPPAVGGAFGQALARETGGDVLYDWGGGLIWAALPPAADAHALRVRSQLADIGGHATLVRASDAIRDRVEVFHPQPAGLAALGLRIKQAFDPADIFNRGRLARGEAA
jgi:glycolate oxidase FAD binding subunit